ncbi:MAG: hypothetical protein D3919_14330 [Candidatus Electrothrix sp. AW5]|nr:hypothetical protein [Candidatus Electrothrix gigas]
MGGVHDLLAAKVPEVATESLVTGIELPGLDADAVGGFLVLIEAFIPEAAGEGGFTGCAFTDQDDFDLCDCAGAFFG